jgi:hypothetical protein
MGVFSETAGAGQPLTRATLDEQSEPGRPPFRNQYLRLTFLYS